ncbi:MAG TPA: twin-arginine translocase subunit TatC [Flavisolibacter sp.]|nr:twin-arginine translocase subunit TatC [Flavisolibacter sp.]
MALSLFRRNKDSDRSEMTFIDHLEILRGHLFRSALAIAVGAVVVGVYNKFFIKGVLMGPTHDEFPTYRILCSLGRSLHIDRLCMKGIGIKMQSTAVSGQFTVFFNVVLIGGFIIAFPFVFWEFWKFIKPALTKKELRNTRGVIFWVSFLFFVGVFFGYFVIAPYTVSFFANFQLDTNIENRWTITSYLDTLIPLILGTGLAFQLPLVMFFLSKVGIVSAAFLRKYRKHAIVIMLVIAGVITPPDVLSQIIVTLPLILLYEVSIVLAKNVEKKAEEDDKKEWS